MKQEEVFEGPLNTLGTNMRSGLEKYAYGKLGKRGAERLNLRKRADNNVDGWLNWITRQRYGGDKIEGDADDLRNYISRAYGPAILQQLEPTINRIAPQPAPAAPMAAAGSAPAAPQSAPAPLTRSQSARPVPKPVPGAGTGAAQASAGGPGSAPIPGAGAGAGQSSAGGPGSSAPARRIRPRPRPVADPADDGMSIPPIPGQMNPEVPPFLQRQTNTPAPPQAAPPQVTPLQAPSQPAQPPIRVAPRFSQRPPVVPRFGQYHAAESVMYRGKLIEVALKRSQIDQIMKQLAVVQANADDYSGHPQQAATPQTPQRQQQSSPTSAQAAPQTAPAQAAPPAAPAQAAAAQSGIDVPKLLNTNVTISGMKSAQISGTDAQAISRAIQAANGSIPLSTLLGQLGYLNGQTFTALLYAAAAS